mgnify:CR=1 FL=1
MARIEGRLKVGIPADLAFDLWSRPEEFANCMGCVIDGKNQGHDVYKITTETPGGNEGWPVKLQREAPRSVRWRSVDGGRFFGEVTLRTSYDGTEIMLAVDYEPQTKSVQTETRRMVIPTWDVGGDLLRFRMYAEGVLEDQEVEALA